ncbi:MAG: tripartite tricarboxylate transporter permease [Litoreibacter sp.]|nr:tripartite tricarboxylate transporter permease [Litoreibacter sp.]
MTQHNNLCAGLEAFFADLGFLAIFFDISCGFVILFSDPFAIFFVVLAAFIGIVFGALPGLTAAAAIAMMLPILIAYNDQIGALAGLVFLYIVGKSGRYGGSIAAILFNTPGTAASAATMQDGYPMTQQGKAGKALKTATIASAYGDYFGEIVLIFGAVAIATFTRKFGPPENFAIYLMAFVVIGSVVSDSVIKGIVSTLFGGLVGLIGEDVITGQFKMTMGIEELESGMALVPLLIGVFVISEVIIQAEKAAKVKMVAMDEDGALDPTAHYFTFAEFKRCIPLMFRSSIYGSLIGMMPGLGSSVACFVAYGEEKRKAKNKDEWGTGIVEGIAAPESANNAVSGPSMIPLLTLGIPGSTIAAVLIGMFLVNGLQPGPTIFSEDTTVQYFIPSTMDFFEITSREYIFAVFAAGLLGIAAYALIGYFAAPFIGKAIAILPTKYLYPFIFMTALAASYSSRASIWDVAFALLFGVIGYGMWRTNFSAAAFIIAFVLTSSMEEAFRQSMIISDNGAWVFLNFEYQGKFSYAPIFLIIGAAVVVFRSWSAYRSNAS